MRSSIKKKQKWLSTQVKLDGKATRSLLLEAGVAMAKEVGIHSITVMGVTQRAGVSHTLITYYFAGIAGLKDAVQEELCSKTL